MSMGTSVAPVAGKNSSIKTELGLAATTNISLRSLSSTAGKASPDAMSEFYGYANASITFSAGSSIGYPSTVTGTCTIVGISYALFATATMFGAGSITSSINVGGNTRSISKTGSGTANSTTFTLGPGSYSYSFTVTLPSGSGSAGIGVV